MKPLTAFIVTIILCTSVYAQEEKERNYALSFGIGNNFQLSNFNMDIAVKEVLDNQHQVRLFLSPRISTSNTENAQSGSSSTSENDNSNYSLGMGVDYLWQLAAKDEFIMYSGTGVIASYGNGGDNKNTTQFINGGSVSNETTSPFWSVGLRGILGVEWRVSERVGIHSEYVAYGKYSWSKTENKTSGAGVVNPSTTTTTSKRFELGSYVLFGLSIYL